MDDVLTGEGRAEAEAIGRRHDVPADAVAVLLAAIRHGGGRQAQFSHPALGGMGQWSRGGGIMIGDMFNHSLKAKVEQLCNELAERVDENGLFASGSSGSGNDWWPRKLGRPSSTGSQNDEAYACFPDAQRLAIRGADGIKLYDTGDHRISGVSQQQGGSRDLTFTSQHGTVRLSDLSQLEEQAVSERHATLPQEHFGEPDGSRRAEPAPADAPSTGGSHDALALLERLHELQRKGILTQEEFAAKKTEVLARL